MNEEDILDKFHEYFVLSSSNRKIDINNGMVTVDGSCFLRLNLSKLPIKFDTVTGNFNCADQTLTSLDGFPRYVGKSCDISGNRLETLINGPYEVGGSYNCSDNNINSLVGAPLYIGRDFRCVGNYLNSLDGIPKSINGIFTMTVHAETPLLKILTVKGIQIFNFINDQGDYFKFISDLFSEYYKIQNPTERIMKVAFEMMRYKQGYYRSNARL